VLNAFAKNFKKGNKSIVIWLEANFLFAYLALSEVLGFGR
jgi:hypothetical protein